MSDLSSQKMIDDIKQLSDEIRLKIHLAGMDARDTWAKLEKQGKLVERELVAAAHQTGQHVHAAADKLKAALEKLRDQVIKPH